MLYLKRKFLLHRLMDGEGGDGGKKTGGDAGGGAGGSGGDAGSGDGKGGGGSGQGDGGAGGGGGGDGKGGDANAGAFGDWNKTIDAYTTARGGDDKLKARLGRYTDLGAVLDSHLTLQEKISKGEFRSTLKADAKPEEVTKWRTENGIPEAPDKYAIKLTGGRKIMKGDEPYVGTILSKLHEKNVNNDQASAAVDTFYEIQTMMQQTRQKEDVKVAGETEHKLRVEWGGRYDANMADVNAFLGMAPKEVKDRFMGGRLADGTPIIHDAATQRWLLSVARQANPVSTVVPLGDADGMHSAIESEIKAIEKDMRAPKGSSEWQAYWKDEGRQSRYRDLLTARDKAKT